MILSSLMSTLTEYASGLYQREWSQRELLLIALVFLVLLLTILRRRRLKNVRVLRPEQLADRPSVIGAKLGHPGNRRGLASSRAGQLTLVPDRREKQQKPSKAKEQPEKSREQNGPPQWEIVKPKQPTQGPEMKVAELAAANEKLRNELAEGANTVQRLERKIAELTAANEHLSNEAQEDAHARAPLEQKVGELTTANEQLQREAALHKEAQDRFEQKLADLAAANERLGAEVAQLNKAPQKARVHKYEDEHRVVDDVKQKLCRKCGQWKAESEFHKNASRKDGLARWCKVCKTSAARRSRERPADVSD